MQKKGEKEAIEKGRNTKMGGKEGVSECELKDFWP